MTALHQSGRTWKYNKLNIIHEGDIDQVNNFSILQSTLTCTGVVGNLVATYVNIDWRQLGLTMTLNVLEGHSPITSPLSGILV